MNKPRFNDRYIREGFPPGWHVQDRLDDNTALLCRNDGAFLGFPANRCICVRPQAISTDEWLPTARQIAARLCDNAQSRVGQESPDPLDDPRVKALVEARKRHIEAINAYNAKVEEARKAREGGDWSIAPHDEFRETGERHREFIAAAQDFADAALAALKGGGA